MAKKLPDFIGFDWDQGNREKNRVKHHVTESEAEEIFFNTPLVVLDDPGHSVSEKRFAAFGRTDQGRYLSVVFTMRGSLVRIISARDMSRKEKDFYGRYENEEIT